MEKALVIDEIEGLFKVNKYSQRQFLLVNALQDEDCKIRNSRV